MCLECTFYVSSWFFFVALLIYEIGKHQMFKNRMQRIPIPPLIFVVILSLPLVEGMEYMLRAFASNPNALSETLSEDPTLKIFIPTRTVHLWFLYDLIMFYAVSFLLEILLKQQPKTSKAIKPHPKQAMHLVSDK
jgi:glucan biosynthesis protein C